MASLPAAAERSALSPGAAPLLVPPIAGAGPRRAAGARLRWAAVAWAAALLAVLLLRLGAAPLFDVDEGAFAEATREMVSSGDYGFTTLDGQPRYDKPILVYWLQAASVGALGVNEAALRLPSALCAFGWALALAAFAAGRRGPRAGALAGTMLATSAGALVIGRASTADALLNLLLCLALLDGWRWLERDQVAPLRRAYLWIGLGLLAKGPVALVIPAAASLAYLLSRREPRRWLRMALDGKGWALLLAVAGPWYAYAFHLHGMDFVQGFLVRHNLDRYATPREGHGGSLGYYALMLPVLLLPWAALLPAAARELPRTWREPQGRFLLCWAGFVLVFFSFSGTKLPHYALYGATPVVLLLARTLERARPGPRWGTAATIGFLLLLLATLPGLVPHVAPMVKDPLYAALLAGAGQGAWAVQLGAAAALAAWVLAIVRFGPSPAALAGGALGLAVVLAGLATPWLGEVLQGPVKRAAAVARTRPEVAVQLDVRVPSFSLYRGRSTPRRAPAPGELAITRETSLAKVEGTYEVLHRERGYALIRLPPAG